MHKHTIKTGDSTLQPLFPSPQYNGGVIKKTFEQIVSPEKRLLTFQKCVCHCVQSEVGASRSLKTDRILCYKHMHVHSDEDHF